jgi:F-type H+-transporting ATPase subunit gamma
MRELQKIRRQLESARDLLSVVRTMKTMAAVNIRQYEQAVESLRTYTETVDLGFQVMVVRRPDLLEGATTAGAGPVGAIVFGSDQGMCGAFNERIAEHARRSLRRRGLVESEVSLVLVGHRVGFQFAETDGVRAHLDPPNSVEGISPFVRALLRDIDRWQTERGIERLLVFFNRSVDGGRVEPTTRELLPIDRRFLERLAGRGWEGPTEPTYSGEAGALFSALVDEYLFAGLFQACAESLAAENAARLMSMQSAHKNIAERLDELRSEYRRTRQTTITSELLDIVGGYEALSGEE